MQTVKIKTILLIDDEQSIRESYAFYLEDHGFKVITAKDGPEGIELFISEKPDLVLVDLRMPEMNGLSVLKWIHNKSEEIPQIVISGAGVISDALEALRCGACDYLLKPINDLEILVHSINRALERRELIRENCQYQQLLEKKVIEKTQELQNSNKRLKQINTRLQRIVEVTKMLSFCKNIKKFGAAFLEEIGKNMSATGGSFYIKDKDGLTLLHSLDPGHAPDFIPFPFLKDSVFDKIFKREDVVLIPEIKKNKNPRTSGWEGYKNGSLLVFPVINDDGEVAGIISLHNKRQPPFTQVDKMIGTIMASYSWEAIKATSITEELQEKEERFRKLAQLLPEPIFETDLKLNITYTNQTGLETFGYFQEDIDSSLNLIDLIDSKDQPRFKKHIQRILDGENIGIKEYKAVKKDGLKFPSLFHSTSIIYNKKTIGFRGFIVNISRQKDVENIVRLSREQLRIFIDSSPDLYFLKDKDLRYTLVNTANAEFFGKSEKEVIGKTDFQLMPIEAAENCQKSDLKAMKKKETIITIEEFDSKIYETRKIPVIKNKKVVGVAGIIRDITLQKEAEESLVRSREQYQTLINDLPVGIYQTSKEGKFLNVNPALVSILEYESIEELLEIDVYAVHEKASQRDDQLYNWYKKKEIIADEIKLVTKNGREIWCRDTGRAVADGKGEIIHFDGVIEDITEYKKAEKERFEAEQQLQKAQKMEAIGQLTGGIAHDFNNLLQIIKGYTDIMMYELKPDSTMHGYLNKISETENKASTLISQLLSYSRRRMLKPRSLNLNQLISELLKMLNRIIGENIALDFTSEDDLALINADRGMVEQVIMNLCINARDAMPKGGKLTIKTENAFIDSEYCKKYSWAVEGRYVLLSILDTGSGMNKEVITRIFEPFFSTKEKTRGTGLGLSTVYGIVKQHKGMIHAYSEPGAGTVFKVYFPISNKLIKDSKIDLSTKNGYTKGKGELILLAEDEEMVRDVACQFLEKAGYKVIQAHDGEEAVRVFNENCHKVDLLVLDAMMPKLSGIEVFKIVKKKRKDVPVLFASGYSENNVSLDFIIKDKVSFIQKPFSKKDFLEIIRTILDSKKKGN